MENGKGYRRLLTGDCVFSYAYILLALIKLVFTDNSEREYLQSCPFLCRVNKKLGVAIICISIYNRIYYEVVNSNLGLCLEYYIYDQLRQDT